MREQFIQHAAQSNINIFAIIIELRESTISLSVLKNTENISIDDVIGIVIGMFTAG